jgi:hypothetical protein
MKAAKPKELDHVRAQVTKVVIEPRPSGYRGVFIVGTNNILELDAVCQVFEDLARIADVRKLSEGKTCAFAVQHFGDEHKTLARIEGMLRKFFEFVRVENGFDAGTYGLVEDLGAKTESKLSPVPRCGVCGEPQAFPITVVSMYNAQDKLLERRFYCGKCLANCEESTNLGLLKSLLAADTEDFRWLAQFEFIEEKQPESIPGMSAYTMRPAVAVSRKHATARA